MKKLSTILAALVLCLGFVCSAQAVLIDYTYSGNFTYHKDVLIFNFTMDEPGRVTMFSSSWINDTDKTKGFDPILAIWDSNGDRLYQQDDGGQTGTRMVNGIEYAYGVYDSYFTTDPLAVGIYSISIAAYNNWAISTYLADGFSFDSSTPILISEWEQPVNGIRGSFFEFHILGVTSVEVIVDPTNPAPTPEPGTMFLMGVGLLGMLGMRKRFKK